MLECWNTFDLCRSLWVGKERGMGANMAPETPGAYAGAAVGWPVSCKDACKDDI
jgi:hypothetical protein